MHSWMIGRDVNQPGPFPKRFGRFEHAQRAIFFPAINEPPCAADPDPSKPGCSTALGDSTIRLQHFVAYVLGANCIQALPNATTATHGWAWEVEPGPVTGPTGCYI